MWIRHAVTALMLFATATAVGQTYLGAPCDGGWGSTGMAEYNYGGCQGCGGNCGGSCQQFTFSGLASKINARAASSMAGATGLGTAVRQNLMGSPPCAAPANAAFGWLHHGSGMIGGNGYHPSAAAYPANMGCGQPAFPGGVFPGMDGGYQDLGGTCCGPHWFDFLIEGVVLTRTGDDDLALMSQGIRGLGPPNVVLGSNDIDFDLAGAIRGVLHWQLNAVHFVEGIYLGGLDWHDEASVFTNNHDLYSSFSNFGNDPFGGFEDSDQATRSSLRYDSRLDSIEVNWRHGWISPSNKFSGTWLIGGRYVRLEDQLRHDIAVREHFDPINMVDRPNAQTRYDINAENDLTGVQVGTELVRGISPGLLIGLEGKAMALANRISLGSVLESTTLQPRLVESDDDTDFSWGTEARVFCLWQFHPWAKFRFGYELLYLGDVATAFGNYDSTPPLINVAQPANAAVRNPAVSSSEDLLMHGFSVGLELGW